MEIISPLKEWNTPSQSSKEQETNRIAKLNANFYLKNTHKQETKFCCEMLSFTGKYTFQGISTLTVCSLL